jgi:hypothetical protein
MELNSLQKSPDPPGFNIDAAAPPAPPYAPPVAVQNLFAFLPFPSP